MKNCNGAKFIQLPTQFMTVPLLSRNSPQYHHYNLGKKSINITKKNKSRKI